MQKAKNPALEPFYALPEEARLLIAYCLVNGYSRFQLLPFDHDVDQLLAKGWVSKVGEESRQLQRYAITDEKDAFLVKHGDEILAQQDRKRYDQYCHRKSAYYPWNW